MAAHIVTAKDINALTGRSYPEGGSIVAALRKLVARVEDRIGYWLRYRATLADLERLTDHQLADVGVARGSIRAVARAAARG